LINHKITYEKTLVPVVTRLKGQGFNAIALRRPCLPLSTVIVSLHYLPTCLRSAVICDKTPNIVTWSEHNPLASLAICPCRKKRSQPKSL